MNWRRRGRGGAGGRPQSQGLAWALSWAVASSVAWAISAGSAKVCPARGGPAEDAPPRLLQIQPAGALGDEHLLEARMGGQPGPGGQAVMTGEVVADHR